MKVKGNCIALLLVIILFTTCMGTQEAKDDTGFSEESGSDLEPDMSFAIGLEGWEKIEALEEKGLTKSILEELDTLYIRAKKEKRQVELIKIIIYQVKYESAITENAHVKVIEKMKHEIKESDEPARSILKSMCADFYWQYFQDNMYLFTERTETIEFEEDDIATWNLQKIIDETASLYLDSLQQADMLKKKNMKEFEEILIGGNSRDIRPTLYDFLAHRALDFFMGEQPYITQPAYAFELDDPRLFGSPKEFSTLTIMTEDSTSLKYRSLLILQDLTAFHLKDKDPTALVHLDVKRLSFVNRHAVEMDKDTLYSKALEVLEREYQHHPSSGPVSYQRARFHYDQGQNYKPLISDDHKWDVKTAYDICESIVRKFPGTEGATNCASLRADILSKTLGFTVEKANLPGKPFRASVRFKNIGRAFFRAVRLDEPMREKAKDIEYEEGTEELLGYYTGLPAEKEWSVALPSESDFQTHSVEITIPELGKGYHIILASAKEDFSRQENALFFSPVWITGIAFLTCDEWTEGRDHYYVSHRETGQPLAGVKVQILTYEWDYGKQRYGTKKAETYTTDKNGCFTVKPRDSRDYMIKLAYKDDTLLFDDYYYQYEPSKFDEFPLITYFFTDRAIYRPGQTIYFKGLVMRRLTSYGDKLEAEKKHNTTVSFYDVNSQVIGQVKLKTNEYGTFSGSFTAPVDRLPGRMCIGNEYGSHYFSVEEYKRPGFEVVFHPLEGSFTLGQKVTVKGMAKAYSGYGVGDASVHYRIVRNASFPYWRWYWGPSPSSGQMEIRHGTGKTDAKGEFSIEFTALPDNSIPEERLPVFTYTVYADVTDPAGETHSNQVHVRTGYTALKLSIDLPEHVNMDSAQEFPIHSDNLNGVFEAAQGTISIYRLALPGRIFRKRLWERPDTFIMDKETCYRTFPYDIYDNENEPHTWEKKERVYSGDFDTKKQPSLLLKNISDWKGGKYLLEMKAKDAFGRQIHVEHYFTLYSRKASTIPLDEILWIHPVKTTCQPGDYAEIELGTSVDDVHVIYEVFHKDRIIERKSIILNREKKLIGFPVEEKHRGNITVNINSIKHNRGYTVDVPVYVAWDNKDIAIEFETFRDTLLPGQKEEWRLKLSGNRGDKLACEMVAALYDASLDSFVPHGWRYYFYPSFYSTCYWQADISFAPLSSQAFEWGWNTYAGTYYRSYDRLDYRGFYFASFYTRDSKMMLKEKSGEVPEEMAAEEKENGIMPAAPKTTTARTGNGKDRTPSDQDATGTETGRKEPSFSDVQVRANLNETAFFYPHLRTDKDGKIIIAFTIPEALTRWKMLGFAHTKHIEYGFIEKELVTRKDLMITPNAPRFFRESDTISFTAKVTNLSDQDLKGDAVLRLFNALSMEPVDAACNNSKSVKPFSVKKQQGTALSWNITIPEGLQAVTYRVIAKAGDYSDGEESTLPVLTNRMLVTESMPLPVKGKETRTFLFKKLLDSGTSKTLTHHRVTLEFTSNPAWYAIQVLPYLMEYPYECIEQVFGRYYANSIATHIANSNPGIKKVFDAWKDSGALISNLEKNEELKALLLQETPWVLQSQDETERKKRVALLFDINRMSNECGSALKKLMEMQVSSGGWPWFPGLPEDRYISQHIAAGMGHLDRLGIKNVREETRVWDMITRALRFLDNTMTDDYSSLIKNNVNLDKNHLSYITIHYLYTRSFFADVEIAQEHQKAFEYWKSQAGRYWLDFNRYLQGMIGLALHRFDDNTIPAEIIRSMKENAIMSEEMGMYWKEPGGYYWFQAPIETQALLIEAFDEIAGDKESVGEMKVWLLKQKQTQDWRTTKATAEACYALLLRGTDVLSEDEPVEITLGTMKIEPQKMDDVKVEAGTGYFKTSWGRGDIKPEMGRVTVEKKKGGVAWGALYWQYFEQLDKITPHETPLRLQKKLFLQVDTDKGPVIKPVTEKTALKPGDLIKVRIVLTVDRDMEYVHMKDMRASAFEPVSVLSGYRYQDGLWYYESIKDASINFFIPWLGKGTYVFEYPLRVSQRGDFSNGITTVQCMYAPEFTSHSEGVRVKVK